MAKTRIHGAEHPLRKIFSDDFVFEIPNYQRPYAWTTEQADELLNDLLQPLEDSALAVDDIDPYFLGSVVLVKDDDKPEAQIVDGQQRLTTLSILFSALRGALDSTAADDMNAFLYEKGNEITGTPNRYRLSLRPRDREFFRTYVQEIGGLDQLIALDGATLSDSQRNIQSNASLYIRRLDSLDSSLLVRLAKYVITQCYLVAVSTPDLDSAYRIFSVMNDRGLELSHADILKAEVVGRLPADQEDSYTTKWEDAEEHLGQDSFKDLFSHIRMIYIKAKQRGTILNEFRKHVVSAMPPQNLIDEVILPYADAYDVVRNAAYESTQRAEEVNRLLRFLNRIDNFDWMPPAMRYFSEYRNEPERILQFLTALERLAASMMIRRVGINDRIERYGRLLELLDKGADLYDADSPLELSREEQQKTMANLGGDLYLLVKPRLYVLLRLDDALSDGGATYDYSLITVEHVLPQSPPSDSGWLTWFPTDELREEWTHKIANLVLLTGRKNSSASNYFFDEKKQKYFAPQGTSPFVLTTQVLSESEWNVETLQTRQRRVLERLQEVWRLDEARVPLPTAQH